MKIVFLDAKTIGDDLDLSGFDRFGEVVKYDYSTPEEAAVRSRDADVLIVNKVQINEASTGEAEHLKLVCVTATGTNNLDKEYLERRNIEWRNVAGYSTETVAQHTFALLFYLMEKMNYYDQYVKSGKYMNDRLFTHFSNVFYELNGKTWGIIGMGNIGRRVAEIAKVFGCNVIYYSTTGKNQQQDFQRVEWEELLTQSDIISVHAPLTDATLNLMDAEAFAKMKPSAIFINVGRGPIVVEEDLCRALETGEIAAAGLDVLREEPMSKDNPLQRIQDSSKLVITPHIAWASVEARKRLMKIVEKQIEDFLA
ncbi:MAG: D-2-hydroxyacid dehydrogenase [Lachnospiraceae bacterium]|nr:D-2-hydroxyacid dehydrogenase [Lachnospiraceae bacterium]MDD7377912.1 D-2-hydroxyacid dehydrogenase [Lachnospiraceae bacterium]MDY4617962.1 D-2-hydroxyacid dehydrogenase [Lachnospiraceae bacterium]